MIRPTMRALSSILSLVSLVSAFAQPACDGYEATFSTTTAGAGVAIFYNTAQPMPAGSFWTFGDGTSGMGMQIAHTFPAAGSYNVCYTAWWWNDAIQDSCWNTTCQEVVVGAPDPCLDLYADFNFVVSGGGIQFSNATAGTGETTTWFWDFGDGTTSTDPQPFHEFVAPGVYAVCLTAVSVYIDDNGAPLTCSHTHCANVLTPGGPCDELLAGFSYAPTPNGVQLINTTTGTGMQSTWLWNFSDGTSSNDPQPFHTFPSPGVYEVCLKVNSTFVYEGGSLITCHDEYCSTVTVEGGDPCDGFDACFVTNDLGTGAFFFDNCTSQQGITQFVWDFGDGGSSTSSHVDHLYQQPGTYTVCLTAYWGNCVDSTCTTVAVENGDPCDGLTAGFWWDSNGGAPENIFYSANTGDASHWLWSFGDGTYSDNGPQGTHTYPGPGEYELCLTVYEYIPGTQDTCSVSSCQWVVITDGNPCADLDPGFSFQPNGLGVNFQNNVLNNQWSYLWTFGDGTTGYGPNPYHTFPSPGAYNVCLVVWTWDPVAQDTCFADHCAWVTVQGGDPCADFIATMTWNAVGGNAVVFTGTTSTPSSGTVWYFGDGTQGTGQTITHTYAQPGEYHVCFMAWLWNQQTQDSCWTEACQWITVGNGNPCDGLNAGFSSLVDGSNVTFENIVLNDQWSYLWSYGDGAEGYGPDPSHTYTSSGTYQVCLTVWTWDPVAQDTCFADHCAWVTVQDGDPCDQLNACFEASPLGISGFQFLNCTNPQSGVQFVWHFGDGSTGSGFSPDHVYQEPGTYSVCLTAYWENCVDDFCSTVTVSGGGACNGDFAANFEWVAEGTAVTLHGTTNLPTNGMIWFFGDGTTGYGEIITHLYEPPGPYNICLAAWYWNEQTQDTCWAEHCELVDPFNTGSEDHSATALRIYPQPANDLVTIDGLVGSAVLRLFASDGRLLLQERSTASFHRLNVADLSTGVYVLNVDTDRRSLRYRISVE